MALNFIIVISNLIVQETIPIVVQEIEYLFLKTTIDDLWLVGIGVVLAIVRKLGKDNGRFEKKIRDSRVLSATDFKIKYKRKSSHYKNAKWSWRLWWKENDQKIIPFVLMAYFLIIVLPYGWNDYIAPNFKFLNDTTYNPLLSAVIGAGSSFIMKAIDKKEREYLD